MLTDLDLVTNELEAFLGANFLTHSDNNNVVLMPATVDEFSEETIHSISLPATNTDEYSLFGNSISDLKPTAYTITNLESPVDTESVTSPAESHQSSDLLDLESVSYSSWNGVNTDSNDPDWLPASHVVPQTVYSCTNTSNGNSKSTSNKRTAKASTSRPAKRRNSSQTSELELQIEIEESTKRAKRCTGPLTEEQKRLRRKELNRLAAQRCRSKRKSHAEVLEDEIDELTIKNRELKEKLEKLESTKAELYDVIKFHFASCHGK